MDILNYITNPKALNSINSKNFIIKEYEISELTLYRDGARLSLSFLCEIETQEVNSQHCYFQLDFNPITNFQLSNWNTNNKVNISIQEQKDKIELNFQSAQGFNLSFSCLLIYFVKGGIYKEH